MPDYIGDAKLQALGVQCDTAPAPGNAGASRENLRKRAPAWLSRRGGDSWRPRKKHRVSSFKWLHGVENALVVGTCVSGWKQWQPTVEPKGDQALSSSLTWPRLSLCSDSGSACVSVNRGQALLRSGSTA